MKKKLLIGILTIALDERLADNYAIYRELRHSSML